MLSRRKREVFLPGWLWFFLILPLSLIVLLLYRQNRLQQLRERLRARLESLPQPFNPAPRYKEPDSIPLEIRTEEVSYMEFETEPETGTDTEDVALAKVTAPQEESFEPDQPTAPVEAERAAEDNLEIIEGIGPVISGILHNAGIITFRQLADTPVQQLREILSSSGLRRLADPGTWPEQAHLAAEGNWDGLEQLKGTLKAGRRSKPAE